MNENRSKMYQIQTRYIDGKQDRLDGQDTLKITDNIKMQYEVIFIFPKVVRQNKIRVSTSSVGLNSTYSVETG